MSDAIRFAIIVPTKGRPLRLRKLLDSIEATTFVHDKLSVFVGHDQHDAVTSCLCEEVLTTRPYRFLFTSISFAPTQWLHRDIVNRLASHAFQSADFVWVLGDDCVIETKHWDDIARVKIEEALTPDGVLYVGCEDSTPQPPEFKHLPAPPYTCFPMVSRAAHDALGFFMHPTIKSWGADLTLFHVYNHFLVERTLALPEVVVSHLSQHNGTHEMDATGAAMKARFATQPDEAQRILLQDVPAQAQRVRQYIAGHGG